MISNFIVWFLFHILVLYMCFRLIYHFKPNPYLVMVIAWILLPFSHYPSLLAFTLDKVL